MADQEIVPVLASTPTVAPDPRRVEVSVSLTVTAHGAPEDAERLAGAVLAAARVLAPVMPGGGG